MQELLARLAKPPVPALTTLQPCSIPKALLPGDRVDDLRANNPPVIARVAEDSTILDLRTVHPDDDAVVAAAIATLVA